MDIFSIPRILVLILFSVGLVNPACAMPMDEARHLLVRTGFGANYEEIIGITDLEYTDAVDNLLVQSSSIVTTKPPAWLLEPISFDRKKMKNASDEQRKAFRKARKKKEFELKGWWVSEMVNTQSPFTEKMVLFWHNHFTSSLKKVKLPVLLYQQNELFREYALGNYKQLAHEISKDPAMLGYLDNFKSSKRSPNENFARELLELFTLGEGNYAENDIKEAARAFTGWSIDRKTGKFKYRKGMHDKGEKTFLGTRGTLDGDNIIEIIFQQPEVEILLVTKLWIEFVSETLDKSEIERLAKIFRANNFEMKPLMREIFLSQSFRSPSNYASLIKSPLDYVVGTLRMLKIPVEDGKGVALSSAHLGLNVFDPPNVKGWPGGKDWITSSSLLSRQQLLERMFRGNSAEATKEQKRLDRKLSMNNKLGMRKQKVDLRPFLESFSNKYTKQEIIRILLADEPVNSYLIETNKKKFNVDDLLALMSDPVYQLK